SRHIEPFARHPRRTQHFRAVSFPRQQAHHASQSSATSNSVVSSNLWVRKRRGTKRIAMNSGEQSDREENLSLNGVESDQNAAEDEARRIRRLQLMISMVSSVISQDSSLTVEEASELAASAKRAALAMFPDKELAYDLLYKPRLQRLMRERFRLQ